MLSFCHFKPPVCATIAVVHSLKVGCTVCSVWNGTGDITTSQRLNWLNVENRTKTDRIGIWLWIYGGTIFHWRCLPHPYNNNAYIYIYVYVYVCTLCMTILGFCWLCLPHMMDPDWPPISRVMFEIFSPLLGLSLKRFMCTICYSSKFDICLLFGSCFFFVSFKGLFLFF